MEFKTEEGERVYMVVYYDSENDQLIRRMRQTAKTYVQAIEATFNMDDQMGMVISVEEV